MTTSRSLVLRTLLGAFFVSLAMPAVSPAQTAQICLSGQYRHAGTATRGAAKCYVKSIKRGLPVDPVCLTERETWITTHFASIEAASNCLVEPASASVWATIQPLITSLATAVNVNGGRCSSKKIGALGREFKQMQRCYAEMAETSAPSVDPDCITKAQTKLTDIFTRLEYNYTCLTNGDAATLSAQVTTDATTVGDYLRGIGTTTTTTTTSTSSTSTTTTTLIPGACPENGAFDPCYAYRDNAACTACVDATVGPDAGIATTLCGGAGPTCNDAIKNAACGYAINTSTTCGALCCP